MASAECEKILLGSWLLGYNREHTKEFDWNDFTYYGVVCEAIKELQEKKQKVDPVQVSKMSEVTLTEITDMTSAYNPSFYDGAYREVKLQKVKNMLLRIDDDTDLEEFAKRITAQLERLDVGGVEQPPDFIQNFIDEMDRRANMEPIKYGMSSLDRVTGGIRPQELTTLAARPSVGKSAMALQIGLSAVRQGKKVLFFSAEMNDIQITERMFCRESKVSQDSLKRGLVSKDKEKSADREEWEKFTNYLKVLSRIKDKLILQTKTRKLSQVKRAIAYYKPDLVIIDQLSLVSEDKGFKSIRERFSYITSELKAFAMDLDVPIILLAQINRDAQQEIPTLANLKESGSIEEDSDNVVLLHRLTEKQADKSERYYDYNDLISKGMYPVLIKVEKQRNGQTGGIYAIYKGERFIFYEVEKEGWKK